MSRKICLACRIIAFEYFLNSIQLLVKQTRYKYFVIRTFYSIRKGGIIQ